MSEQQSDDGGQVSEVGNLGDAETPISDSQSVAGNPDDTSGDPDTGPAGPNANPHADEETH